MGGRGDKIEGVQLESYHDRRPCVGCWCKMCVCGWGGGRCSSNLLTTDY